MNSPRPGVSLIAGFVWWGALLNLAGWGLSLFRVLNPMAYGLALSVLLGASLFFLQNEPWRNFFLKSIKRFRRPLPAAFACAVGFILLGALGHAPSNYDALTYRIPRILHWLNHGGWFWIATANPRQNYSGVGQEWLLAPILALTATSRLLFLPNFFCFLLLPSVFFRVFRGLGCSGRTARTWMWLFPFAPVYLLQAGGIANDLLGAFWFLASLALLPGRFLLGCAPVASVLSLALATGVKASNLVLLLPWLVKFLWQILRQKTPWHTTLLAAPLAWVISFAPLAYLNSRHTGDWSGDPSNEGGMKTDHPLLTLAGNTILVISASLQQPFELGSRHVISAMGQLCPPRAREKFSEAYPRWSLDHREFAIEEGAAWSWMLFAFVLTFFFTARRRPMAEHFWVTVAVWVSVFFMMGKLASEAIPRLLAPLYPLLLIVPEGRRGQSSRAGKVTIGWIMLFLGLPLLLAPSRPLVPWSLMGQALDALDPTAGLSMRITRVQEAYHQRARGLLPLIPRDMENKYLRVLLISNGNDMEGPLWWPLGKRQVESRRMADAPPQQAPDLILIREKEWPAWSSLWQLTAQSRGRLSLTQLARVGAEEWLCLEPLSWPVQP
ncbi:MAG: hypothetical protein EBT69_07785 [Verrucomicrobia bacterium]|nr:hypothetical protein [Verrucomicrobiota bacterium]